MSLAKRSVTSVAYNTVANAFTVSALFVRMVLLARLVPVDVFGSYGVANVIVTLSAVVINFGMGGAFLHRTAETQNEDESARVYFTLLILFDLVWALCLFVGTTIWARGSIRTALFVLTVCTFLLQTSAVPRSILVRRVIHRRLAVSQMVAASVTATLAIILYALNLASIWSLLVMDIVSSLSSTVIFFVWRPVWRIRFKWDPSTVQYYLSFGSRNFLSVGLLQALDEIDDLWTSIFLGKQQLAYYTRAFTMATYPRRILAAAVNSVAAGTYAELKDDRQRLSQSFFRANALLVRAGFLLAGIMALVAPEFIRLVLTDKWMPMLTTFRLMLVFTMLDPIKITVASLLVAVGKPEKIASARGLQLLVLIAGLFALGPRWGISGVAVAVDLMLIVGLVAIFRQCRQYVDISLRRLFLLPLFALASGIILARATIMLPGVLGSDWRTGLAKLAIFVPSYIIVLFLFEQRSTWRMLATIRETLHSR